MRHAAPGRQGARQVHPHRGVAHQHDARRARRDRGVERRAPALGVELGKLALADAEHPVGGAELAEHRLAAADERHRDLAADIAGQPPRQPQLLEGDVGEGALEMLRHHQDVGGHHSTPFDSSTASSSSAPSSICAPSPLSGGRISTTFTPSPLPAAAPAIVSRVADSCTWRTRDTGA